MMQRQSFANVWDALEATPEAAANMTLRADLLIALTTRIKSWNLTQTQAAKRLGLTQPCLNELLRGKVTNFSLDALVMLAGKAGLSVELTIRQAA